MVLLIQILNMAANLIISCFTGAFMFMGVIFFLISFNKTKLPALIKKNKTRRDLIYIFSTLAILLIIFLLSYFSLRMTGDLAFKSDMASEAKYQMGVRLIWLGFIQGIWFIIALRWLLPLVFDPVQLNKKQISIVVSSVLLNLLVGLLTILSKG